MSDHILYDFTFFHNAIILYFSAHSFRPAVFLLNGKQIRCLQEGA